MPQLSITSANAIYMLSIPGLYPTPQQLQGFGVNQAFDTEQSDIAEIQLGVDGLTAAGWVPRLTRQTITFLAPSPSTLIFETWAQTQDQMMGSLYANAVIIFPSLQRQYNFPNGTMTRYKAMPDARRVMEPRTFEIMWGWPIIGSPYAPGG